MENWKSIAFLLAFGQGLILSISLIIKGLGKQRHNLFFGFILFTLALELLNAWGMQVHYHSRVNAIPFWNLQSYLILPPSFWLFCQLTTRADFLFKKKYWLLFLPALIQLIVQSFVSFYKSFSGDYVPSLLNIPVWFIATEIVPIIGMIIVLIFYSRKLLFIHRSLKEQSCSVTFGLYARLYGIFGFMVALTTLWAMGVVLNWPVFSSIEVLVTLFLFVFGYLGYMDPSFFIFPVVTKVRSSEKPEFLQYDDKKQLDRLMLAFRQDALYIQPKLSLEEVAGKLNLPERYISYLINTHYASNFNHFVNGFRVQEVIKKLGDPAEHHKTILALALESGFNSKSTFNQVFKQHTGKAPSEYLIVSK